MTLEEMEAALAALEVRTSANEEEISTVKLSTPTLEELWWSNTIDTWSGNSALTGSARMTLMVAPLPCRIQSVDLSFDYTTLGSGQPVVPASNTNYWRAILEKSDGLGNFPDLTAKSTQSSGAEANGAIFTRKCWSFDSANWGNRDLEKGELLCLNWVETGSPAPLRLPMTATVRLSAI